MGNISQSSGIPSLTEELEIFGIWSDGSDGIIILNKFVISYLGGNLVGVCGPAILSNLKVYKGQGEGEEGQSLAPTLRPCSVI